MNLFLLLWGSSCTEFCKSSSIDGMRVLDDCSGVGGVSDGGDDGDSKLKFDFSPPISQMAILI